MYQLAKVNTELKRSQYPTRNKIVFPVMQDSDADMKPLIDVLYVSSRKALTLQKPITVPLLTSKPYKRQSLH